MNTGTVRTPGGSRQTVMTVVLLAAAACLICAMSDGIKNNYGIMLSAIIENSGLTYASVSFVLAIGQLLYGMFMPIFGLLAQKKGTLLTLLTGVCMMLAGLLLLPQCRSPWSLIFCLGILLPAGTGATSYGILIGAVTPRIPAHTVSLVSGVVNASSGIGNAVLSPIIQALLAGGGIFMAMLILSIPTALMIPLCFFVGRSNNGRSIPSTAEAVDIRWDKTAAAQPAKAKEEVSERAGGFLKTITSPFADAFRSRTYRLLMVGFFTCGFHMALISNHLPSQITSYGISAAVSSYVFSVYGIVTMIGSVLSGWLAGKLSMKNVLGTYYALRSVIAMIFLLLPKTIPVVYGYAILLGMTGAATVPPVSGLIGREFGAARVGTLYGFVFFIHSIGGFLGAWLGGLCVEFFGGYVQIWVIDMLLCVIAAAASWLIRETK